MPIEELFVKQQELMDRVPHNIRADSHIKIMHGFNIIESLLKYLNSTGHKPWRPIPLPEETQQTYLQQLFDGMFRLDEFHAYNKRHPAPPFVDEPTSPTSRQLISALGIIEESTEYVNSLDKKDTDAHRIEELTDQLFFWLEQVLMSGFTWEQIEAEYHRKWQVNIARYESAQKNDYSWDKRKEVGF